MMITHDIVQSEAVAKLSRLKAGALFMKMGTGKTKVALDLIKSRQRDIDLVLWLAPASLVHERAYRAELAKWSGGLKKPVRHFTIEGISQSDRTYLELRDLAAKNRVFIIVDESSLAKNNDAKRTKRLLDLRDLCDFRLILNGTPISKSLLDLQPQIDFIHPHILNMTEAQFADHFLIYLDDGEGRGRPWRRWSKPANEAALVELIRPYIFDADLDIPAKLEIAAHEFQLSAEEADGYAAMKQRLLGEANVPLDFLAVAQALQHHYSAAQQKLTWVYERLNDSQQHLVFVKFHSEVDRLLRTIDGSREYTGRSKSDVHAFERGRTRVLIVTYGTGSHGLNLQFCNHVMFFTQTFDWKVKEQALHRVYRIGQTQDVLVDDLWIDTGLEGIIRKSLAKKQATSANVQRFIQDKGVAAL